MIEQDTQEITLDPTVRDIRDAERNRIARAIEQHATHTEQFAGDAIPVAWALALVLIPDASEDEYPIFLAVYDAIVEGGSAADSAALALKKMRDRGLVAKADDR